MQRSQKRRLQLPQQGQMQPIRVTVDHIEITGSRGKLVEEYGMRAHWLPVPAAQAQAARDYRHKLSARDRITTREQGHVVPEIDQLLGEPCDDPLGPPIKVGGTLSASGATWAIRNEASQNGSMPRGGL